MILSESFLSAFADNYTVGRERRWGSCVSVVKSFRFVRMKGNNENDDGRKYI